MRAPIRASLHKHSRSPPKQRKHAEMAALEAEKRFANCVNIMSIGNVYICAKVGLWSKARITNVIRACKCYVINTVHTLFCLLEALISASLLASTNLWLFLNKL